MTFIKKKKPFTLSTPEEKEEEEEAEACPWEKEADLPILPRAGQGPLSLEVKGRLLWAQHEEDCSVKLAITKWLFS